nr:hypothetical protein [Tanacetum cinerariifolium]
KKRFGKKESVSKQGRKKDKPEPTLDDSTFDADYSMDYMDTEEPMNEERLSKETEELMKEEKSKEKGVSIKDKDSSRHERSNLTLKPLPTIDPNDNVKGVLKEPDPVKKMTRSDLDAAQIAKDVEVARLIYKEELAELEREKEKKQREEEASKAAIAEMYDEVQLKATSFVEIQGLYERQKRVIDDFKPMDLDDAVDKEMVLEEPEKGVDLVLLGDLRTMFEEITDDDLWKNQEEWILKSWNFYENYEVHTLTLEDGTKIYMLAERRYPLAKETLDRMLALRLIAESKSEAVFDLLRFIQKKIDESGSHDGSEKDLAPCYCNEALAIPEQTATDDKDWKLIKEKFKELQCVWIHPPGVQEA